MATECIICRFQSTFLSRRQSGRTGWINLLVSFRELAAASGFSGAGAVNESARLQGAKTYFDEFYIGNPAGLYNLKALFQPDPAIAQGKTLTASALVRVMDGPDSLELLKQKLVEKKK